MKSHTQLQKKFLGFKPELHWEIIIITGVVLALSAIGYDTYVYTFARDQISKSVIISIATSTDEGTDLAKLQSYTSTAEMSNLLQIYEKRAAMYESVIDSLSSASTSFSATGTASGTIATSSKQ